MTEVEGIVTYIDAVAVWLATGLGLGQVVPLIPGTAGALAGALLYWWLWGLRGRWQWVLMAFLIAVAVPICELGGRHFGGDDPRIIADELLVFPVAVAGLPARRHPALLAGVFVTSRLLDRFKPPPVSTAECLPGGIGIVADDVAANLCTLALWALGWRWWRRRGNG